MTNTISTREQYLALFTTDAGAVAHEERCLSVDRRFLPPCAKAVIDGKPALSALYWQWLADQIEAK